MRFLKWMLGIIGNPGDALDISTVSSHEPSSTKRNRKWVFVADSVPGAKHITQSLPCQDCFTALSLNRSWQLMVIADGAGSSANSQGGSAALCTSLVPRLFTELVETGTLVLNDNLPSIDVWKRVGYETFLRIQLEVNRLAQEQGLSSKDYYSTLTVAIFSEAGLLVAHVGDGRGAYLTESDVWEPCLRPHKGEEPNQTVFVNSKWDIIKQSTNGVVLPEFSVFPGPILAVALLTDGMENHAFHCSMMDTTSGMWSDPNEPYLRFFAPLRTRVLASPLEQEGLNQAWTRFLKGGTNALKQENDDKTLVLACIVDVPDT